VRLYISGNSGNQKIENEQQQIQRVLQMRKLEFELVDIMLPGNQNERAFMREHGKKKDGQRNVIPPQIFNGQEFRGDFEDFDIANEDDVLEEFLGLERLKPKIEPFKTGAVAPEVNKLKVGKLDLKEEEKSSAKKEESAEAVAEPEVKEANEQEEVDSAAEIDSCDSDSKPAEESDSGVELDEEERGDEDEQEANTEQAEDGESSCGRGDGEGDEDEKNVENEDLGVGDDGEENETDTEDFTDSEDDEVEYMDDGEPVRKCKRGFKILQNCKRFWKASYD